VPKVKWGAGAASASEVNEVDTSKNRKPYMGEIPPAGVYRFILKTIKAGESKDGNAKALVFCVLDGTWQPSHNRYDGCPMWDHLPLSVAGRVRSLVDALGITAEDFLEKAVMDENKVITKAGRTSISGEDLYLYIDCERDTSGDKPQLKPRFSGYLVLDEDEMADGEEVTGDDGEEPPF
jgi:hypothetical protein